MTSSILPSDISLTPNTTLGDAIAVIERGGAQIALVVDNDGRLIGTITDGDVRRALLRGETLQSRVDKFMRREFRCLTDNPTRSEALALMRLEKIHQIPAVDQEGRVTGLFILEELLKPSRRPNWVVLMAGGKGRRLRPFTDQCPKPMIPIGDKPMLEIILDQCIDAGFREFFISVNYLKDQVKEYFADGRRWGVDIKYLEESDPLGTGGALSLLPSPPVHPLLVINGDILTRVDFSQLIRFHEEHHSAATLCVREHATQIPYGVVEMDGSDVRVVREKPVLSHYVNAGIYLLNADVIQLLKHDSYMDMPQLLEVALRQNKRVSAFPIHEYWLDVGFPEALERAQGEW